MNGSLAAPPRCPLLKSLGVFGVNPAKFWIEGKPQMPRSPWSRPRFGVRSASLGVGCGGPSGMFRLAAIVPDGSITVAGPSRPTCAYTMAVAVIHRNTAIKHLHIALLEREMEHKKHKNLS